MTEYIEPYEKKAGATSPLAILKVIVCTMGGYVLYWLGWLSLLPALVLCYSIAFLIEYWIPPKPPVSYPRWIFKVVMHMLLMGLGVWIAPIMLSRWIWPAMAYALPIGVTFTLLYLLPPFYPVRRKEPLWKWSLLVIGVTLLFGWVGYLGGYK